MKFKVWADVPYFSLFFFFVVSQSPKLDTSARTPAAEAIRTIDMSQTRVRHLASFSTLAIQQGRAHLRNDI